MSACHGNGADHCCYYLEVCEFLEENTVKGRRWVCGLFRRLGSWEAVHASDDYQRVVQPQWDQIGDGSSSCGSWPQDQPNFPNGPDHCCFNDEVPIEIGAT